MTTGIPRFDEALQPYYAAPPNAPLLLFRGWVDLVQQGTLEPCRGGVSLGWFPTPRITSWVTGPLSPLSLRAVFAPDDVDLVPRLPPRHVPRQGQRRATSLSRPSLETSRTLQDLRVGSEASRLSSALAHLVNFPRLVGRPIRWPDGSVAAARLAFTAAGWTIVLDQLHDCSERLMQVQANGGYAFTHVARLTRTDGSTFSPQQLIDILEAFAFFCWLCAECRGGPVLPVGFDARNRPVWSRWVIPWLEPYQVTASWLDELNAEEAEALFPLFMARYLDLHWKPFDQTFDQLPDRSRPPSKP